MLYSVHWILLLYLCYLFILILFVFILKCHRQTLKQTPCDSLYYSGAQLRTVLKSCSKMSIEFSYYIFIYLIFNLFVFILQCHRQTLRQTPCDYFSMRENWGHSVGLLQNCDRCAGWEQPSIYLPSSWHLQSNESAKNKWMKKNNSKELKVRVIRNSAFRYLWAEDTISSHLRWRKKMKVLPK